MRKMALSFVALCLVACQGEYAIEKEYQLALAQFEKNKLEDSLAHIQNALQHQPDHVASLILYGDALLATGDPQTAEQQFRKVVDLGVDKATLYAKLAKAMLKQNKFVELLEEIQFAGELSQISVKDSAQIFAHRGMAYMALGQYELARSQVAKAFSYDENNPDARIAHAGILIHDGKYKEAVEFIHKLISLYPEQYHAWLVLADIEKQYLNLSHAEKAYTAAINYSPPRSIEHYYALLNRAIVRGYQDQFHQARSDVHKAQLLRPNEVYAEYTQGFIDFRAQNYEDARLAFTRVLSQKPNHMLARLYLGAVYFLQRQPEQALTHLQFFSTHHTKHPLAEKLLAMVELQSGHYQEASSRLHSLVQQEGADTDILNLLGAHALTQGQYQEGIENIRSALEQKPTWPGALMRLGLGEMERGDYLTADKAFDNALKQHDHPASSVVYKFLSLIKQKKYDDTVRFVQELPDSQVHQLLKYDLLGIAWLHKHNPDKARSAFNKVLALDCGDPTARHNMAYIALKQNKTAEAMMHYQEVLKSYPDNIRTYLKLAALDLHLYKINDAKIHLHKALSVSDNALGARLALVKLYLDTAKYDKALQIIDKTPDLQQEHPMLITLKGIAHAQQNNWDLAAKCQQQILQRHAEFTADEQFMLLQAYLTGHEKGVAKALRMLEKIQASFPNSRNVVNLASAYFKTQRSSAGERVLLQWLKAHPLDATVRLSLANFYMQQERYDLALNAFEQVAEVVPSNPMVLNNIAWLLKESQPKRAMAIVKQALEMSPNDERIGHTYQEIKRRLHA